MKRNKRSGVLTASDRLAMVRAKEYTCPKCKVKPGETCAAVTGRKTRPHSQRLEVVRNEGMS